MVGLFLYRQSSAGTDRYQCASARGAVSCHLPDIVVSVQLASVSTHAGDMECSSYFAYRSSLWCGRQRWALLVVQAETFRKDSMRLMPNLVIDCKLSHRNPCEHWPRSSVLQTHHAIRSLMTRAGSPPSFEPTLSTWQGPS